MRSQHGLQGGRNACAPSYRSPSTAGCVGISPPWLSSASPRPADYTADVTDALSVADLMHKPAVVVHEGITLADASTVLDHGYAEEPSHA